MGQKFSENFILGQFSRTKIPVTGHPNVVILFWLSNPYCVNVFFGIYRYLCFEKSQKQVQRMSDNRFSLNLSETEAIIPVSIVLLEH